MNSDVLDIAVGLSVTHDVHRDVKEYLASGHGPSVRSLMLLKPTGGPSTNSVQGPDHTHRLTMDMLPILQMAHPHHRGRVHLFFACPNALMFLIGRHREALGPIALYEFDFANERTGSYTLSFQLPPVAHAIADCSEVIQ